MNKIVLVIIAMSILITSCSSENFIGRAIARGCVDTDGGINEYAPGTVFTSPLNNKLTKGYADVCGDQKTLTEFYCGDGVSISTEIICSNLCIINACVD